MSAAPKKRSIKRGRSEQSEAESDYNSKHQTSGGVKASSGASGLQTLDQATIDNATASSSDESANAPVAPSSRRATRVNIVCRYKGNEACW
jgi:hypothetical protein